MKTKLALVIVSMLVGELASASMICTVNEEDSQGNYSKVLATKDLAEEDKSIEIYETKDVRVFVNTLDASKHRTIFFADLSRENSTTGAVASGDLLVALNQPLRLSVVCSKFVPY